MINPAFLRRNEDKVKKHNPDDTCKACNRLGKVGGQAVLEGVMMKAGDNYCVAIRKPDNTIDIKNRTFQSVRKKHKILNLPLIRGMVNFVEMMILSFKTLAISIESLGIEEEETRFEKWLQKHFGRSIMDLVMGIATVLGLILGIALFTLLPTLTTAGIDNLTGEKLNSFRSVIEGVIRIGIFVLYIYLVSLMKEIRRTFEYHGAEHKAVACYESGDPLTVENTKKHNRYHARCGTNFIFVMLIISIIVFSFVTWSNLYIRVALKLILIPLIVGIGYEFIMFAGKHTNPITKIFCAPGLLMQRITTREPDDSQIEIAITALKNALPDEFPEVLADTVNNAESEFSVFSEPTETPESSVEDSALPAQEEAINNDEN
ncbi:MAG: DUF1385 domain-containing protein [Clostridiales bacterium]|nr:DUF1385 domain-containing protein [Clostridiales bacterium]